MGTSAGEYGILCGLLAATTDPSQLGGVTGFLVDLMNNLGGPGIAFVIMLENVFPPIPSELFLPLAGFTASQPGGDFSLAEAIIWSTIGSVIGALILYWAGAAVGHERTRALADRMPLVKVEDFDRTSAWFEKHGRKAVFFGRMLPLFRSLVSIPAGVDRMPLVQFVVLTAMGSAIWNSLLIGSGYKLGTRWEIVEQYAELFSSVVLLAVIAWLGVFTYRRLRGQT